MKIIKIIIEPIYAERTKIIFKSAFEYKAYSKKKEKSIKQNVPAAPSTLSNMLTEFIIKIIQKIEKNTFKKNISNMGITKPAQIKTEAIINWKNNLVKGIILSLSSMTPTNEDIIMMKKMPINDLYSSVISPNINVFWNIIINEVIIAHIEKARPPKWDLLESPHRKFFCLLKIQLNYLLIIWM